MDFAFIEDDAALRAAIEDDNFGRWRVFLHPEQRDYAFKDRNGSFRLSGGAGTGKSVVLLHRARHLASGNPRHTSSSRRTTRRSPLRFRRR